MPLRVRTAILALALAAACEPSRDVYVLPGATYTYRVRAWINVLYSDFSNVATATVP